MSISLVYFFHTERTESPDEQKSTWEGDRMDYRAGDFASQKMAPRVSYSRGEPPELNLAPVKKSAMSFMFTP